jgi:uncharacterized protein (DUF2141 family)
MKPALLFLLASLLAAGAAAQERNGSIIGTVSDAVSHQPLRKVKVTLVLGNQALDTQATTDDAGAFAFHDLKPGQYQLGVEWLRDYTSVKVITVSPSENPDPIKIELIPGTVVSGRILDEDGDPLNGCGAQVRRAEHPEQIIARTTGEPGDYRLFGLRPGKYILAVQCPVPVFQSRPFSAGPDPPPSLAYPLQFYPAALDAAAAEQIQLAAGTERAGVDFRMRTAHVTQVRAVIAPSSPNWHGRDLIVQLIGPGDLLGGESGKIAPGSPGNVFQFPQVFPGSYVLLAATFSPENRIGAVERVEVKDQPVNTVIELKHAIDVHGTVELESSANSANVQLPQINIQLRMENPEVAGPYTLIEDGPVQPDGSFTLNSMIPVQSRLYAFGGVIYGPGGSGSFFIKSVRLGNKESSGRTIDLSSGSPDTLKIVLSANTATIHGTAPPGTFVACRSLDDEVLSRESPPVEQSGQYRIEGLAPGRYRVTAVPEGESSDAIPKDSGREVTVQEGETATVDLAPN